MYLIISSNKNEAEGIFKIIKNAAEPIFAYFRSEKSFESLLEYDHPLSPKAIIINNVGNADISSRLCEYIKATYPSIPIGIILTISSKDPQLFKYLPNSDQELILPVSEASLLPFLKRLRKTEAHAYSSHVLSLSAHSSSLLGYDLHLSPSENIILLFLSTFNTSTIPADIIKDACFLSESGSSTSIRVLIDRINKKAKDISGRPIILSRYGQGYYLNPNP